MIILGLGSNKDGREGYLRAAVEQLAAWLRDMRLSRIYESQALLPPGAPPEWNMPYLNMAVCGEADIAPQALLARVKETERQLGRRPGGAWGPREIDIDILAMGEQQVRDGALVIPHPEMLKRDFVLLPVAELAPHWRYPVPGEYCGMTAAAIAQEKGFALHEGLRIHG